MEAAESLLVRVVTVRVQNKFGAIFFGHRVNPDGEICDVDEDVTVNLQQNAVGVKLYEGQRWRVTGRIALRNVLTATGFKRVERTVFVSVGGASLVRSSGSQIRDYLRRHPDLIGVGLVTANRLWDRFGEDLYPESVTPEPATAWLAPMASKIAVHRPFGAAALLPWCVGRLS